MTEVVMGEARDVSTLSLGKAIAGSVAAGFGAALKVLLLHGVVFAIVLGVIAWWASLGGMGWRWVMMVAGVYGVHAAAAPFVVFFGSIVAAGSAVGRLGVGRALFAAAARRAEALDPRLREKNDFGSIARGISEGLDAVTRDPASWAEAPAGRTARVARWGRRLAMRIVRFGARAILREMEMVPHADGRMEYATVDEWFGARADNAVGVAVREPALRWLALVLAVQLVVTLGLVVAAVV
jgi:hypothetical protein